MSDKVYKRIPRGNISLREAWNLEDPTDIEIKNAETIYKTTGQCEHILVTFEDGWLYDFCYCATCKTFITSV